MNVIVDNQLFEMFSFHFHRKCNEIFETKTTLVLVEYVDPTEEKTKKKQFNEETYEKKKRYALPVHDEVAPVLDSHCLPLVLQQQLLL